MAQPSKLAAFVVLALACNRSSSRATPTPSASVPPPTVTDAGSDAGQRKSTFALTVDDRTIEGTPNCKVLVSPSQPHAVVSWHGQCKSGFADGLGVARYVSDGIPDSHFYGVLKEGQWESGVYADDAGYRSGQFKDNEPVEIDEVSGFDRRNAMIRAFDTGAKAATRLSDALAKQGNKDAAKHYRAVAEKLSRQMD